MLMNMVWRPHDWHATAYIDDIMVYSKIRDEHLIHLAAILPALKDSADSKPIQM